MIEDLKRAIDTIDTYCREHVCEDCVMMDMMGHCGVKGRPWEWDINLDAAEALREDMED